MMAKITPIMQGITNKQTSKTPNRNLIISNSLTMSARGVIMSFEEFKMVKFFLHSYSLQRTTKDSTPGLERTLQRPSIPQCGQMRFNERSTNATALAFSSSILSKAARSAALLDFCSASFLSASSFSSAAFLACSTFSGSAGMLTAASQCGHFAMKSSNDEVSLKTF